jgi:RNA polymerase sigma-70 factor (ECF subfamily)
VQETLLQAHAAIPQFKGKTEDELLGWLRVILANKLADAARYFGRQKRDAALETRYLETLERSAIGLQKLVAADQTSPSGVAARNEVLLRTAAAMSTLPEDQRTAIELHHLVGFTVSECAERMDRSKPAVAGLLRRGLKALREALEPNAQGGT